MFQHWRFLPIFLGVAAISGCGTVVPSLQELPSGPRSESQLVVAVVQSIQCELQNAVVEFTKADLANAPRNGGVREGSWFDSWGAQVALTLTVQEQTTLSPNATWLPPAAGSTIFSLAGGLSGSSQVTRTDKSNFFFSVKDLYKAGTCTAGIQPKEGVRSPLIQNDLRLGDWLFDQFPLKASGIAYPASSNGAFKQNVLSHEVKFEIITSGNITPVWKLVRANVDSSGTLLSTNRDRTSDLVVTFGPIDPSQKNGELAPEAESAHFLNQFNAANATRPGTRASIF